MDSRYCAELRRLVIDARGSTDGLPAEALRHLGSCGECSAYLELVAGLASGGGSPVTDYVAADLALRRAQAIASKRRGALEAACFVAGATVVAAAIATAGALGWGVPLLAFQALVFVTLPFAGYAALRRRIKGGSPWTA